MKTTSILVPIFNATSTMEVEVIKESKNFWLTRNMNETVNGKVNTEYGWYAVVFKNLAEVKNRQAVCKTSSKRFVKVLWKMMNELDEEFYMLFITARTYEECIVSRTGAYGQVLRDKAIECALDYYQDRDKVAQYTSIPKYAMGV